MITGVDAGGHPVRLGGGTDAAQLLQARLIQAEHQDALFQALEVARTNIRP